MPIEIVAVLLTAGFVPALCLLIPRLETRSERRLLIAASAVHLTNDACFALLFPLLPLIAADLHLSYAEVGLVKTVFSVSSSALQIPAGVLGERFGEYLILLVGNAWVGVGLIGMALAGGYLSLLALALVA